MQYKRLKEWINYGDQMLYLDCISHVFPWLSCLQNAINFLLWSDKKYIM
jgi:hypothetical protein